MKNKPLFFFRILLLLVILLNLFVVFDFSSEDASASTETSRGISDRLTAALYPDFESLDAGAQAKVLIRANTFFRTLAHCVIFSPMAFAGTLFGLTFPLQRRFAQWLRAAYAPCFSFAAALFDEIHQAFVPGRAFQLSDLLYDSIGILCGCLFAILVFLIYQTHKRKGASK